MTVPLGQPKIIYTADGVRKEWAIPFVFRAESDLKVSVSDDNGVFAPLSGGVRVEMRENVQTLIYPTEPNAPALKAGRKILILRQTPTEQTVSFTSLANPDPRVQEEGLDKNVLMIQELAEEVGRAVKFPPQTSVGQTDAAEYLTQLSLSEQKAVSANALAQSALEAAQEAVQTAGQTVQSAQQVVGRLEQYAFGAQSGASAAASSALAAATSAQLAKKWAVQTAEEVEEGEGYGAKKYAQDAAASAEAAYGSATSAADSASDASASASSAQADKTAAQGYSADAGAKAEEAQNYSLAAQTSAQSAAASAANSRGLAVGTVYYSQSSLASDNPGALALFTGETIASANAVYPDFWTWLSSHEELQCTAAQYAAALETYGECAKYVLGSDGSLRLPLLKNYVKMANAADGVTQHKAGLPNITGHFLDGGNLYAPDFSSDAHFNGAFSAQKASTQSNNGQAQDGSKITFNASASSAVYGASDTVTPAHTTLFPWVCAFNAAVAASVAQAGQFQQALTGKADKNLDNIPENYDYVVERWQAEEASVTWGGVAFYNSYEIYKSGWCRQTIYASGTSADITYLKPFAKAPHIKTDLFGGAGSAYFAHSVGKKNNVDITLGCSVNWSGSENNPYGVIVTASGYTEEQ